MSKTQTEKQSLLQVYKVTGVMPEKLKNSPRLPDVLTYIWAYYLELSSDTPLSYTELNHWSQMTKRPLAAWEVKVLKAIDRIKWRYRGE